MGDTYLVRVGLLGVLGSQFRSVFIAHISYSFLTFLLGGYRILKLVGSGRNNVDIAEIWNVWGYTELFLLHSIVAALYYLFTLRAAFRLTDPQLYSKELWIDKLFSGVNNNSNEEAESSSGPQTSWI